MNWLLTWMVRHLGWVAVIVVRQSRDGHDVLWAMKPSGGRLMQGINPETQPDLKTALYDVQVEAATMQRLI